MMRLNHFVAAAAISLIAAPSLAQNWVEYVHQTDRFTMMFPGMPEVRETTHVSAHDVIFPARVYSVQDGPSLYALTVVDYTDAERRHELRPDQTDASSGERFWVMDVRASVAHAAQSFRQRGGQVTYEGWADIDKIEGHQMQIINPDQSRSFIGIHLHGSRLYILEGRTPAGDPPAALFQQSLRFLDAEGRRVRYVLDPDGQRIGVTRREQLDDELEGVKRVVVE